MVTVPLKDADPWGATTADATININIQTVVYRGDFYRSAACEILATAKSFKRFSEAKVLHKLPTQDLRISHKKLHASLASSSCFATH